MFQAESSIGKVIARCPSGTEPTAMRLRLARLLADVDLTPAGLSPSAVLVIRRLRGAVRGGWNQRAASAFSAMAENHAIGAAIERAVGQVARRAALPALGFVPADAEAVIFRDRAELLACLASDWSRGLAGVCWWWRSLFPGGDWQRLVPRLWAEGAEYVPAAIARLAQRREAVAVIESLGEDDARLIRRAVTRRFALHEVERCLNEARTLQVTARFDMADGSPFSAATARWTMERIDPALNPEPQALLGLGLMLVHEPSTVRSQTFARSLRQWLLKASEAHIAPRDDVLIESGDILTPLTKRESFIRASEATAFAIGGIAEAPPSRRAKEPEDSFGFHPMDEDASFTSLPLGLADGLLDGSASAASVELATARLESRLSVVAEDAAASHPGNAHSSDAGASEERSASLAAQCPAKAAEFVVAAPSLFDQEAETQCGGVFYLVNLGLHLNLYGDFTAPQQPGVDLPIWDFLALVAEHLVGERLRDDAVWPLLARLAGRRETDEPGAGFTAPEDWSLPEDWLVDDENPPPSAKTTAQQWIEWLIPHLRLRLLRALGCDERDLGRLLIEHQALVTISATHLDVRMSLSELPVEIRFAGLDRDPGWVPAAGKFIAFHFE